MKNFYTTERNSWFKSNISFLFLLNFAVQKNVLSLPKWKITFMFKKPFATTLHLICLHFLFVCFISHLWRLSRNLCPSPGQFYFLNISQAWCGDAENISIGVSFFISRCENQSEGRSCDYSRPMRGQPHLASPMSHSLRNVGRWHHMTIDQGPGQWLHFPK